MNILDHLYVPICAPEIVLQSQAVIVQICMYSSVISKWLILTYGFTSYSVQNTLLHTKNTTEFLIYHCNNNILKPRNYNLTGYMYYYVDYFVRCSI
jgi:hypothetical protein